MKKILFIGIVCAALAMWVGGNAYAGHSARGCNNCHVPHWAGPYNETDYGVPLWSNQQLRSSTDPLAPGLDTSGLNGLKFQYVMYSSKGFDSPTLGVIKSPQPDGPSKLCLGCHDGSYSKWAGSAVNTDTTVSARKFETNDLTRMHPISFVYDSGLAARSNGTLWDPATKLSTLPGGRTIQADLLDSKDKVQCTSCHDVHISGQGAEMLRFHWSNVEFTTTNPDGSLKTNSRDDHKMCLVCHNK